METLTSPYQERYSIVFDFLLLLSRALVGVYLSDLTEVIPLI